MPTSALCRLQPKTATELSALHVASAAAKAEADAARPRTGGPGQKTHVPLRRSASASAQRPNTAGPAGAGRGHPSIHEQQYPVGAAAAAAAGATGAPVQVPHLSRAEWERRHRFHHSPDPLPRHSPSAASAGRAATARAARTDAANNARPPEMRPGTARDRFTFGTAADRLGNGGGGGSGGGREDHGDQRSGGQRSLGREIAAAYIDPSPRVRSVVRGHRSASAAVGNVAFPMRPSKADATAAAAVTKARNDVTPSYLSGCFGRHIVKPRPHIAHAVVHSQSRQRSRPLKVATPDAASSGRSPRPDVVSEDHVSEIAGPPVPATQRVKAPAHRHGPPHNVAPYENYDPMVGPEAAVFSTAHRHTPDVVATKRSPPPAAPPVPATMPGRDMGAPVLAAHGALHTADGSAAPRARVTVNQRREDQRTHTAASRGAQRPTSASKSWLSPHAFSRPEDIQQQGFMSPSQESSPRGVTMAGAIAEVNPTSTAGAGGIPVEAEPSAPLPGGDGEDRRNTDEGHAAHHHRGGVANSSLSQEARKNATIAQVAGARKLWEHGRDQLRSAARDRVGEAGHAALRAAARGAPKREPESLFDCALPEVQAMLEAKKTELHHGLRKGAKAAAKRQLSEGSRGTTPSALTAGSSEPALTGAAAALSFCPPAATPDCGARSAANAGVASSKEEDAAKDRRTHVLASGPMLTTARLNYADKQSSFAGKKADPPLWADPNRPSPVGAHGVSESAEWRRGQYDTVYRSELNSRESAAQRPSYEVLVRPQR